MGWDVVTIGLNHDLPIDDPSALAHEVSVRLNRNIKLGYWEWLEYDDKKRCMATKSHIFVELDRFVIDESAPFYYLTIRDYHERMIREQFNKEELKQMNYSEDYVQDMLLRNDEPFELYELESDNESSDHIYIRFFRENVDLDVYQTARWFGWLRYFKSDENKQLLYDYRKAVFEQAKAFGCSQVVYFADQGPTQNIYDQLQLTSQELIDYINNRFYLFADKSYSREEQEEWVRCGKIIQYEDYFDGSLKLYDEEFIDVIYDDFRCSTFTSLSLRQLSI